MWNATSTTNLIGTMFSQTGTILLATIGTIVAGVVALMGLGYAIRALSTHITGPGFNSYKVGTSDEYPKKWRNAFIEAVGMHNDMHG